MTTTTSWLLTGGRQVVPSGHSTRETPPDLGNPWERNRAIAVLRSVAAKADAAAGVGAVDVLTLVDNMARKPAAADCALIALRDWQEHHVPGWTSWPAGSDPREVATLATRVADELEELGR